MILQVLNTRKFSKQRIEVGLLNTKTELIRKWKINNVISELSFYKYES